MYPDQEKLRGGQAKASGRLLKALEMFLEGSWKGSGRHLAQWKLSGVKAAVSVASSRQPVASSQQPAASGQRPAAGSRQPAASSQRPAASSQQPAASSQQPAASSQQPAASGRQPAASSQPPAASSQQLAVSRLQAAGGRPLHFTPMWLYLFSTEPNLPEPNLQLFTFSFR